jgi:hypothetical protein
MKRKTKVTLAKKKQIHPNKKYHKQCAVTAKILVENGLINKDVYKTLGISEVTGIDWKKKYPEFKQAFIDGKKNRIKQIKGALIKKALGFSIDSEEVVTLSDGKDMGSHWEKVPVIKYFPPDIAAIKFYLKNRWNDEGAGKEKWSDRQELELSNGDDGEPFIIEIK